MERMGLFRTIIEIESWDQRGRRRAVPDTLVDTGSEYTWVPREVLESLGIRRTRPGPGLRSGKSWCPPARSSRRGPRLKPHYPWRHPTDRP